MNSYIVTFGLLVLCAVLITADEKQQEDVTDLLAGLSDDAKLEIFNDAVEEVEKRKNGDFEDEYLTIDNVGVKLDAMGNRRRSGYRGKKEVVKRKNGDFEDEDLTIDNVGVKLDAIGRGTRRWGKFGKK